ncbi:hypothetical protein JHL18_03905 [Clostridium sp. YIM B02505]|uniref:Small-conductance mechanosensitive channel n=1 Tax=Clostridium yunnanense TaxID=2800325 RepID=A0ABS1EK98_9CLOT|nr:hypothetical protein [Clostridium yunnanense]MBK1809784.1 hypothetical protein [Clostridium yunnanense]
MKKSYEKAFLIITSAVIFILPLIGSLLRWGGLPPGYGLFPAQKVVEAPGFSVIYFTAGVLLTLFIFSFLIFPKFFGFKKPLVKASVNKKFKYPLWFWWSIPVLCSSWFLMWTRIKFFAPLSAYAFVPLWWSFILILDGLVYKRNSGVSLISKKPGTMQLLAVVSCLSWFAFEYLNFFVIENWYYPNDSIFSNFGNIFWFSLSYTTVLPAIFEWYLLLKTFPSIRNRYSFGPKISVSRKFIITYYLLGIVLAFGMGYYPYILFWVLWVALVPLLSAAMELLGLWTPLTPINDGNWSPVALIGLATLLNGFFWELWNYGSGYFHQDMPTNPNFWKYTVPYLDKVHIFSEMPILGYCGYLFFGINCWIIWLICAYIFNFDHKFDITEDLHIVESIDNIPDSIDEKQVI